MNKHMGTGQSSNLLDDMFTLIDNRWQEIGILSTLDRTKLKSYNKLIGLYKLEENGETIYIGKATEDKNGGFRKRIRDYNRLNDSGRGTKAGKYIYENQSQICVSILIIENTSKNKRFIMLLERLLINRFLPKLNIRQ